MENTLVYNVASPTTERFILPQSAAIFSLFTTITTGFVTMSIQAGQRIDKIVIGQPLNGLVFDMITNSTLDSINVVKRYSKISFENGGTHTLISGGTIDLTAATAGLVIVQWIQRA